MASPDVPLLRKAVEWVEEQDRLPVARREWMQWRFVLPACGDARFQRADLADRAAVTAERESYGRTECGTCYCVAGYVDHLAGRDSEYGGIPGSAQELLGLGPGEADALFHAANTAPDVRRIAESIAGEHL